MRISFSFVFFLVSGATHGVGAWWLGRVFPGVARHKRVVAVAVVLLALLTPLARLLFWGTGGSPFSAVLITVATVELAAAVMSLVPLGLVTVASRVLSKGAGRSSPATPVGARDAEPPPAAAAETGLGPSASAHALSRRHVVERLAGLSIYGVAATTLGWGAVRGRHAFETRELVVRVSGWPRALDGYVIAQVSDVHVGAFVRDRELDEGFALVRALRPDLVVATGDLVDFLATGADALAARLAAVGARDGAFAIPGNHDHYAGPAEVVARMRRGGVRVLCNEGVRLRARDGGGFALLGVDDLQGRRTPSVGHAGPDLGRAIAMVPPDAPRILLAHQPRFFDESAGRVALQLSGHTHGGQVNPGIRPASLFMRYVDGRYERDGSTLWVNRGFGVVASPPARVGAPPEVTKIVVVG